MARQLDWAVALCTTILAATLGITCSATNDSHETSSTTSAGGSGAGSSTSTDLLDASTQNDGGDPLPDCDPTCQAAGGTCKDGVCTLTDNPGNLDGATQTALKPIPKLLPQIV